MYENVGSDITESKFIISAIPKAISLKKLKFLIESNFSDDMEMQVELIPLEKLNMARLTIKATSSTNCDRFLRIIFNATPALRQLKLSEPATVTTLQPTDLPDTSVANILDLSHDCLRYIFQRCTLKSQIALAKVCEYFYELIVDIWRLEYKSFNFNLHHLNFNLCLDAAELRDFLTIAGKYVQTLVFNTIFSFPLIHKYLLFATDGNVIENAKKFMNIHFCKHLMYFENVEIFEVEGKFLADFTVRQLANYCRKLRVFELIDADTRWLLGKHFYRLENLELLLIKDCANVQPRYMRRTVRLLKQLKQLNMLECKSLQQAHFISGLCRHFNNLVSLQLSAIADESMLEDILLLPSIRHVQFYWLNDYNEFEDMLYPQLLQHSQERLSALKFNTERIFCNYESSERLNAFQYAMMREKVVIDGRPWTWLAANFEHFSQIVAELRHLQEITFEYSRLLSVEQLIELPLKCSNLRRITFIGCREKQDELLVLAWQRAQRKLPEEKKCQLNIKGLITADTLEEVRKFSRDLNDRTKIKKSPVLHSIECHF